MRNMKLGAAILATGLAFVGACGDDEGGTPDATPMGPDAAMVDGGGGTPDAGDPDAMVAATRSGTISIQDVKLTDGYAAAAGGIGGLQATVFFSDLEANAPVAPAFGTGGIGSCNVYQWTVDAAGKSNEPPDTDEGAVTIGGAGLLATVPNPCTAVNGKYICVVNQIAAQAASTKAADPMNFPGHSELKFDGIDFTAAPYNLKPITTAGAVPQHYFTLSGFTTGIDGLNLSTNGLLPGTTDTLLVFTGTTPLPTASWTTAAALVTTGSAYPAHGGRDSINGGTGNDQLVTVSRAAGVDLPAMAAVSLKPAGEGFKLDSAKGQPHLFPTTAADFVVSCETGDGVCGPNPELLTVFLMSGRATNGVITGKSPIDMPAPLPNSTYATFNCSFIGAKSATVPSAAVAKILETNPTRMQTRVFYTSGNIVTQGQDVTNVLVGHGLIGHTTFPASN